MSTLEQELNSVEILKHYCNLEQEAAATLTHDPDDTEWPREGGITFEDVQLRYRPDLPLVLKGLNCDVKPGEKVGILGRTGAGKTLLVQALFRTVELAGGKISIDGVDLASIGLQTVSRQYLLKAVGCFHLGARHQRHTGRKVAARMI
jgi:ATP-binding cassette, subfamily C (CFTR/MRP), member 1